MFESVFYEVSLNPPPLYLLKTILPLRRPVVYAFILTLNFPCVSLLFDVLLAKRELPHRFPYSGSLADYVSGFTAENSLGRSAGEQREVATRSELICSSGRAKDEWLK